MDTLSFGCLHQTGDYTVGLEPLFGSRSETHLAEDDPLAQRLLGMIVGRRHPWDAQEGEEAFLFRPYEIPAQGFGRLERKRPFANGLELCEEGFFHPEG